METLKELRIKKGLTQQEVANRIGVSLRSYVSYENDISKREVPKYRFFIQEVEKMNLLDEEHGILHIDDIVSACKKVLVEYDVEFCYLFGSYAKGNATEVSDVDLLICTQTTGLQYYEMTERLRESLKKKVDVLDLKQLLNNETLLKEVLKEGIRIYE